MTLVRMRPFTVGAIVLTAAAPVATAVQIEPLRTRDAVVVKWQPQNSSAVVAFPSGRLALIHTLRRFEPGRRATVQGIKWGTPTSGIKWAKPPAGIKWGIKWGRNGTYRSGVKAGRRAVWTPVRGPIVKRLNPSTIVVGVRGSVVVVRLAASPRPRTQARTVPPVGAVVSFRGFVTAGGVVVARNLKYLKPPVPGQVLPVGGVVESVDPATRTVVLIDTQDPANPARFTIVLPADISIDRYRAGQVLAVEGTIADDETVDVRAIAQNESFSAADDPAKTQISTEDEPACPAAVGGDCPSS